jgi:hypothetical protein
MLEEGCAGSATTAAPGSADNTNASPNDHVDRGSSFAYRRPVGRVELHRDECYRCDD